MLRNENLFLLRVFFLFIVTGFIFLAFAKRSGKARAVNAGITVAPPYFSAPTGDSAAGDSALNLPYPFEPDQVKQGDDASLYLQNPSNMKSVVEYDASGNEYTIHRKVGDMDNGAPASMTQDEYNKYDADRAVRDYWKQRIASESYDQQTATIPSLNFKSEVLDRVFGGSAVSIRPNGSAELTFKGQFNNNDNPILPVKMRRTGSFDFDEKIQLNVIGQIGDKLKLNANWNTESTFDFQNQMKLEYSGYDDDIIKKIEAGNVALPITGTLITGSQSLFGLKTELQFGKLYVTSVMSQQKGQKKEINITGGAQTQNFEIKADEYESDKHFFLAQYFSDNYDQWLSKLPVITSPVTITKIEVWVTGITGKPENTRNIVAFMDMAETAYYNKNTNNLITAGSGKNLPYNGANTLYANLNDSNQNYYHARNLNQVSSAIGPVLVSGRDFEKVESARLLTSTEYSFHPQLGFISLAQTLNSDEVLAVAYQFTVAGEPGAVYQVGEFSNSGITAPNALFVKLLKSTQLSTDLPMWNLMMKNVYAIGSYNISQTEFRLDVLYANDKTGTATNYISEGAIKSKPLIRVLNLDNLNTQSEPYPDGVFDFLDKITINKSNGRVYFPETEPFGKTLRVQITGGDLADVQLKDIADRYVYDELYTKTKTGAQEFPEKNKFFLKGSYQSSSSSEIFLGAVDVPQGSVVVTAGTIKLTENVDYTVDYNLGRVTIINQGYLQSGTPIKISLESQSLFSIQSKSLMGTRFDYKVSKDFTLGGTFLRYHERPITKKVNISDEPLSNMIWGVDANYRTEAPFVTRAIDLLPIIDTKEPSNISLNTEFAHLIPGHSGAIGKDGTTYLDDFEGSKSAIDLKSLSNWVHASVPQKQTDLFPEGGLYNNLRSGMNRARIAWYIIDPLFHSSNTYTPDHIKDDEPQLSNNYVREIVETEIFPNKVFGYGTLTRMPVFDVAYYPSERGPYNFDAGGEPGISEGMDESGNLKNPQSRWGGIMRPLETNDFELANVEYIEFWMMDPFNQDQDFFFGTASAANHTGGDLYFDLGDISEDILKDSRKSFENGIPSVPLYNLLDTTAWGVVPEQQSVVDAFDSDPEVRKKQDVGLDGLNTGEERTFFNTNFLHKIDSLYGTSSKAYTDAYADPAADTFHYYRGTDFDNNKVNILERYKLYDGLEGNSKTTEQSTESYPIASTTLPNKEDINRDNTLSENERYFQYKIKITPQDINPANVGNNFITDAVPGSGTTPDGNPIDVYWYQFKIPIAKYEKIAGNIQDFKSIRFLRMFLKGFQQPVILRFARLELVRSDWRKYKFDGLTPAGEVLVDDKPDETTFNLSVVNIEENSEKTPVNYVLPPDIEREQDISTPNLAQMNEQSMVLELCGLKDGEAKAVYKNTDFDMRLYKRLKMFVHAEAVTDQLLNNGDLTIFLRLGTDFSENYYEYEIPLSVTPPGKYDNMIEDQRKIVWPESNTFDFAMAILQDAKQERNKQDWPLNARFEYRDGKNMVYVQGNPNISKVKTIMLGVRNPARGNNILDDGLAKCAEVWINELRLSDFDEHTGWAANSMANVKLADLGSFAIAGNILTPGFGGLETKLNERSKETKYGYDASTTLQLGRFLGEKTGIRIPMYIGKSEEWVNPQYNPLDPDIKFRDAIKDLRPGEADTLRKKIQARTKRRSINFTNVQKTRTGKGGKSHVYDVENLSLSYSFSEIVRWDVKTEHDSTRNYRGAIGYNFSNQPKNISPFSKIKFVKKSKYLQLIKDFNFYYAPSLIAVRTEMNRQYRQILLQNIDDRYTDIRMDTTFTKSFTWSRAYDFKFDLSKGLKLSFSALNNAFIGEPRGEVYKHDLNRERYEFAKDSIVNSIKSFGRTRNYSQTASADWTVPINKIPITDWVTVQAGYSAKYDWTGVPVSLDTLGNTIQNSFSTRGNANMRMLNFYNKVPYLKMINNKYGKKSKTPQIEYKTIKYEKSNVKFTAKEPRKITHKLGTTDLTKVEVYDEKGQLIKGKLFIVDENRITYELDKDLAKGTVVIEGKKPLAKLNFKKIVEKTIKTTMSVQNVSLNYNRTQGSMLPGFTPHAETELMGMNSGFRAPGWDYIFGKWDYVMGKQDTGFPIRAAQKGWLTSSKFLNTQYTRSLSRNITGKATLEPFPDIRIELSANQSFSRNYTSYYRYSDSLGTWAYENPQENGNFTISFIAVRTAFRRDDKKNSYASETFKEFTAAREQLSGRLAQRNQERNPNYNSEINPATGYPYGFGGTSQNVLIPAFLAAYSGKDPNRIGLDPFSYIPLPNWSLTYTGLTNKPLFKKYFKTFTVSHTYRGTMSISSYTTNLLYKEESIPGNGEFTTATDINGNFYPHYEITQVTISDQFSPLVKFDMNWINNILSSIELKKDRSLSLNLVNNQLTEYRGYDIVFGTGYRFKQVIIPVKFGGSKKELKSDLNLKLDFSLKSTRSVIRKLVEQVDQITGGQRTYRIGLTADYVISQRFNVRAFYNRSMNKPFLTTTSKTSNWEIGITLRFTLSA